MLKNKKTIINIIITFLLCFPLHFLYQKIPCFITSIISPVNESIWEHMKILFTSIIFTGIIEKIYAKNKKIKYNNILFCNYINAIISIPIFLLFFIPIYNNIGENLPITIIIMLISIVLSKLIATKLINHKDLKLENISIILIIITYMIFALLTYLPPKLDLFLDPQSLKYGVPK
ncbi:MAG: DUF6512 family protein [Candidatus Coprovivens sp.]